MVRRLPYGNGSDVLSRECPQFLRGCSQSKKRSQRHPSPYWGNTSGNDILQFYLEQAVKNNYSEDLGHLQELLNGIPQEITLQEFTTYPDMAKDGADFDTFMTLLLHTGYLTFADNSPLTDTVMVRIPNFEVKKAFAVKLKFLYGNKNPVWVKKTRTLLQLLLAGDAEAARDLTEELLGEFISLRDTGQEYFYHGFMQGVLAPVAKFEGGVVTSEAEGGDGYADLALYQGRTKTAVILKCKKRKNEYDERVKAACEAARQITTKKYVKHFVPEDCSTLYGMGIGFGGKSCAICNLGNLVAPCQAIRKTKAMLHRVKVLQGSPSSSFEPGQKLWFGTLPRRKNRNVHPVPRLRNPSANVEQIENRKL